jgi:hypothetical protein
MTIQEFIRQSIAEATAISRNSADLEKAVAFIHANAEKRFAIMNQDFELQESRCTVAVKTAESQRRNREANQRYHCSIFGNDSLNYYPDNLRPEPLSTTRINTPACTQFN